MLMLIKKIRYTSLLEHNFNTSHVNVNQSKESFMVLQMLISIHLMLMLIYTHIHTRTYARTISIHLMLMLIFILHISFFVIFANFNTSHVNVNLYGYPIVGCASFHFNTSHVNPLCSIFCNKYCSISIHLMLMLIL